MKTSDIQAPFNTTNIMTAQRKMRFKPRQPSEDSTIELHNIPMRYRLIVAAWVAGIDLKTTLSRSALYRNATALRLYGIEINPKGGKRHEAHSDAA